MRKNSRNETEEFVKEAAKILFAAEIKRLMAEYGAVRIAETVDEDIAGLDTLVLFSPVFCAPGHVPIVATTVLDNRLCLIAKTAYGSLKNAAHEFGLKKGKGG